MLLRHSTTLKRRNHQAVNGFLNYTGRDVTGNLDWNLSPNKINTGMMVQL